MGSCLSIVSRHNLDLSDPMNLASVISRRLNVNIVCSFNSYRLSIWEQLEIPITGLDEIGRVVVNEKLPFLRLTVERYEDFMIDNHKIAIQKIWKQTEESKRNESYNELMEYLVLENEYTLGDIDDDGAMVGTAYFEKDIFTCGFSGFLELKPFQRYFNGQMDHHYELSRDIYFKEQMFIQGWMAKVFGGKEIFYFSDDGALSTHGLDWRSFKMILGQRMWDMNLLNINHYVYQENDNGSTRQHQLYRQTLDQELSVFNFAQWYQNKLDEWELK